MREGQKTLIFFLLFLFMNNLLVLGVITYPPQSFEYNNSESEEEDTFYDETETFVSYEDPYLMSSDLTNSLRAFGGGGEEDGFEEGGIDDPPNTYVDAPLSDGVLALALMTVVYAVIRKRKSRG